MAQNVLECAGIEYIASRFEPDRVFTMLRKTIAILPKGIRTGRLFATVETKLSFSDGMRVTNKSLTNFHKKEVDKKIAISFSLNEFRNAEKFVRMVARFLCVLRTIFLAFFIFIKIS